MPTITEVEAAVFIPEVWSKEALIARIEAHYMASRVARKDSDVKQMGDLVHFPEVANLSANAVAADGSITPQAPTETEVTIAIDKWYESSVDISDKVGKQSMTDLASIYGKQIGAALARQMEIDLINLEAAAAITQNTAEGAAITDPILVEGIAFLDNADAPLDNRFLLVRPSQKGELLQIDKFVRSDATGSTRSQNPINIGVFGDIYGIPLLVTSLIGKTIGGVDVGFRDYDTDTVKEYINLMWQKDGLGLAVQNDVKTEQLARTKLSKTIVGHTLYGVKVFRPNHVVRVPTTS